MAAASGECILMIEDARLDSGAHTDSDPTAVLAKTGKSRGCLCVRDRLSCFISGRS